MAYVHRYTYSRPRELLVPVFVSNPRFIYEAGSLTLAIIYTGANSSFIDKTFATRDLIVMPREVPGTIAQPALYQESPPLEHEDTILVADLDITVQYPAGVEMIRKRIELSLFDVVDLRSEVKLILGMDFLNSLDMTYFLRPKGAIFTMLETP